MTSLVSGVVFPGPGKAMKAKVVNIFQVLIISACVMRVGTLVIILRNINDLANGVRAQGGSTNPPSSNRWGSTGQVVLAAPGPLV